MKRTTVVLWTVLVALWLPGAARGDEPSTGADAVGQVRQLLAADDWADALVLAEQTLDRHPRDPDVIAAVGECRFRAGRLESLAELLAPVAELAEPPARAAITLARLHAAEGRTDDAAAWLDRAVSSAPDDREVLYWAGDLAGPRERAIELLEQYLERADGDDPDRIAGARATVAILRQLGDRRLWVNVAAPDRVELPLRELWSSDGRIEGYLVEVRLGRSNKPVRLLLDTGSHGLFLLRRIARKRGFVPLGEQVLIGGGGGKRHETERGTLTAFDLGGLRYTDALATTTRRELDPTGRFHGLLGISIFGGYRVTLDFRNKVLRLERSESPLDGAPYWWVSGQMLVRAAGSAEVSGLFIIDSGASGTTLSDRFVGGLDQARVVGPASVRAFGGSVPEARIVQDVRLDFLGLDTGERRLIAHDFSARNRVGGIEVSGLVGLDLLAGRTLVIDTTTQRIAVSAGH